MPAPLDLLPQLLRGAVLTLGLTIGSLPVAVLVAFIIGLARLSRPLVVRASANVFMEIFRGTSLLVQLYILFYLLPLIGVKLGPIETGILGLGLNSGAYGSEIVRGAILNVDPGQRDAAIALNMTRGLAMRRVILPQALFAMLPSFGNSAIELLKSTSLTSLITISELSNKAAILNQSTHRVSEVFTLVLIVYFIMAFPLTRVVRRLERWSARGLSIARTV